MDVGGCCLGVSAVSMESDGSPRVTKKQLGVEGDAFFRRVKIRWTSLAPLGL